MSTPLTQEQAKALLRWRLVLGSEAESAHPSLGIASLVELCGDEGEEGEALDEAMEFVYGRQKGKSQLNVPEWLGRVRRFFKDDVVALVQKDAMDRKGLTRLLFEPETLPHLERNVDLVATLVSMRGLVPDEAKDAARGIIREVVEALKKQLETETRTAIYGALRRNAHSPLKLARNIDYPRTIRKNLRTWDASRKRLVPETISFFANQRKQRDWEIILLVDQSGSMAVSCVYSAIMASIFASLDVLATRLVLFNHEEVVDMTPVLTDPVEVLFTAQLGGAEDYNRALRYAEETYLKRHEKTILILLTDLFHTAGSNEEFLERMRALVDSKVKTLVLLKLSDAGKPHYNHELAKELTAIGVRCFGATPRLLVDIMARIMRNEDIAEATAGGGT
ncbi:MAG: VWA domain-containing protein [Deltaproteobacteria bacterium]|nr:VWA domain-containing protein [Deltaproteobacteria bacterium]